MRRLKGHLNTILQNRDGEGLCGHGGKPQSEIFMHSGVEALDDELKFGHPADGEMAILKQHPISLGAGKFN